MRKLKRILDPLDPSRYPLAGPSINPLSAPTIITEDQTITTDKLIIAWTAVAEATQYQIYVNSVLNITTAATSYLLTLNYSYSGHSS